MTFRTTWGLERWYWRWEGMEHQWHSLWIAGKAPTSWWCEWIIQYWLFMWLLTLSFFIMSQTFMQLKKMWRNERVVISLLEILTWQVPSSLSSSTYSYYFSTLISYEEEEIIDCKLMALALLKRIFQVYILICMILLVSSNLIIKTKDSLGAWHFCWQPCSWVNLQSNAFDWKQF